MKLIQAVLRSATLRNSHPFPHHQSIKAFATNLNFEDIDETPSSNLFGSEKRAKLPNSEPGFAAKGIFPESGGSLRSGSLLHQMARGRNIRGEGFGGGSKPSSGPRTGTGMFDDLDESFSSLSDGVDSKLMKAARYFEYDSEEVDREDYAFRPDMAFVLDDKYEPKDLDLTKPAIQKPFRRFIEFETTTEEVLRKADFRNVRFLANFITEGGILKKRNQTGISAKAQRKVAREIKTARAFGLIPFTTMGSKQFVFGRTMESLDEDYEFETQYDTTSFVEDSQDPI